jgi:hypothetical protein
MPTQRALPKTYHRGKQKMSKRRLEDRKDTFPLTEYGTRLDGSHYLVMNNIIVHFTTCSMSLDVRGSYPVDMLSKNTIHGLHRLHTRTRSLYRCEQCSCVHSFNLHDVSSLYCSVECRVSCTVHSITLNCHWCHPIPKHAEWASPYGIWLLDI